MVENNTQVADGKTVPHMVRMAEKLEEERSADVLPWKSHELVEARLWLAKGLQTKKISVAVGVKLMRLLDGSDEQIDGRSSDCSSDAMIETTIF